MPTTIQESSSWAWLWGCAATGTVPSDGLTPVSSDAHREAVAERLPWSAALQKDHIQYSGTPSVPRLSSSPLPVLPQPRPPALVLLGSMTDPHQGYLFSLPRCTPHTSFFLPWGFSDMKVRGNHMAHQPCACANASAGTETAQGPPSSDGRQKQMHKCVLPLYFEFSVPRHIFWGSSKAPEGCVSITGSSGQFLSTSPCCLFLWCCFTPWGLSPAQIHYLYTTASSAVSVSRGTPQWPYLGGLSSEQSQAQTWKDQSTWFPENKRNIARDMWVRKDKVTQLPEHRMTRG